MSKPKLRLVVDNTLVVWDQPFDVKVVVTRDEMEELRKGYPEWVQRDDPRLMHNAKDNECPFCEMGIPVTGGVKCQGQ
jgi:hypothetical protein